MEAATALPEQPEAEQRVPEPRVPEYRMLPVRDLFIDPDYQRELDERHVRKIADTFDWSQFQTLEVSLRARSRGAVFDGQHRLRALEDIGIDEAPCLVHVGLTPGQEADLFRRLQDGRKQLSPLDRFKARLAAEPPDPVAIAIDESCRRHGVRIGWNVAQGDLAAIVAAERIFRRGNLDEVLGLILRLWHAEKKSLDGVFLDGLSRFLYLFPEADRDHAISKWEELSPVAILRKGDQFNIGPRSKAIGVIEALREAYTNKAHRLPTVERAEQERKYVEHEGKLKFRRVQMSEVRDACRDLQYITVDSLREHLRITRAAALQFVQELARMGLLGERHASKKEAADAKIPVSGVGQVFFEYIPVTQRKRPEEDPRSRPRSTPPERTAVAGAAKTPGRGGGAVVGTGKRQKATNRDVAETLEAVQADGAKVRLAGSGHWEITHPDKAKVLIANTPRSQRTVLNDRARLRREGYAV